MLDHETLYYSIILPKAKFHTSTNLKCVYPHSSKILKKHVERFANYFLRERRKGSIQYEAAESPGDDCFVPYEAYLFIDQGRYVGACCFRERNTAINLTKYELDWIWLHPYFRSRGLLAEIWPSFKSAYGKFGFSKPITPAMQRFLNKIGHNDDSA
jgi:hypothetical protein